MHDIWIRDVYRGSRTITIMRLLKLTNHRSIQSSSLSTKANSLPPHVLVAEQVSWYLMHTASFLMSACMPHATGVFSLPRACVHVAITDSAPTVILPSRLADKQCTVWVHPRWHFFLWGGELITMFGYRFGLWRWLAFSAWVVYVAQLGSSKW